MHSPELAKIEPTEEDMNTQDHCMHAEFDLDTADAEPCENPSDRVPSSEKSSAGEMEVLEAYPAMLYYSSMMLFYHAEDAQEWGADPRNIVLRLVHSQSSGWLRWLSLREDMSPLTRLEDHCLNLNLTSWIEPLLDYHLASTESNYLEIAFFCFSSAEQAGNIEISLEVVNHQVKTSRQLIASNNAGRLLKDWNILHTLAGTENTGLISIYQARLKMMDMDALLSTLVNMTNMDNLTPLLIASVTHSTETIKALLDVGANPNVRDSLSRLSPLHNICRAQPLNPEIIRVLINKGAQVDAMDSTGKTPMSYLHDNRIEEEKETLKAIELLVEAGADPSVLLEGNGMSPMHLACISGFPQLVKKLLQSGAKCDALDFSHSTPLHYLCSQPDDSNSTQVGAKVECIEILLRAGANTNHLTKSRETAIELAEKVGFTTAVEVIRKHQASGTYQRRLMIQCESISFTSEAEFHSFL
jgi:ankyrin repeat protein